MDDEIIQALSAEEIYNLNLDEWERILETE